MRRGRTARGQALVEFALVLPILLLIVFAFVQLLLLMRVQSALASVARSAVHQAALVGGETATVDAAIITLARQNGLDPGLARVQMETDGGAGAWHWSDWHDAPGGTDHAASYPPRASYNGDVTVSLTYAYPSALPFIPLHIWTVAATASETSQLDGGMLPQ